MRRARRRCRRQKDLRPPRLPERLRRVLRDRGPGPGPAAPREMLAATAAVAAAASATRTVVAVEERSAEPSQSTRIWNIRLGVGRIRVANN